MDTFSKQKWIDGHCFSDDCWDNVGLYVFQITRPFMCVWQHCMTSRPCWQHTSVSSFISFFHNFSTTSKIKKSLYVNANSFFENRMTAVLFFIVPSRCLGVSNAHFRYDEKDLGKNYPILWKWNSLSVHGLVINSRSSFWKKKEF